MFEKSDLTKVAPPKELTDQQCAAIFKRLSRTLASFRNTAELRASTEADLVGHRKSSQMKEEFTQAMDDWTQDTLKNLWLACREPGGGTYYVQGSSLLRIGLLMSLCWKEPYRR